MTLRLDPKARRGKARCLIVGLLAPSLLALCATAPSAQLVAYDGFGNGPLPNLAGSSGGSGWSSNWTDVGNNLTKVALPGLTWPGLALSAGAAVTPTAGGAWPNSDYQRAYSLPANTQAVYVSFLMRDDAAWGSWAGLQFGTYPYAMTVGSPLGYSSYGMTLSEGLGDVTNKPLVMGETTFVVVKISKNTPAAGISYGMYLDPAVGSSEPSYADAFYAVGPVNALPTSFTLTNGTGFTTDEIRVGLSWDAVLPSSAWSDLSHGKIGVRGIPQLVGSGSLEPLSNNTISVSRAAPSAQATFVLGLTQIDAPFKGGTLVPTPSLLLPLVTSAAGSASIPFVLPSGLPSGTEFCSQLWVADATATFSLSASNGLLGTTP